MPYIHYYHSPIGVLKITAEEEYITGLFLCAEETVTSACRKSFLRAPFCYSRPAASLPNISREKEPGSPSLSNTPQAPHSSIPSGTPCVPSLTVKPAVTKTSR